MLVFEAYTIRLYERNNETSLFSGVCNSCNVVDDKGVGIGIICRNVKKASCKDASFSFD